MNKKMLITGIFLLSSLLSIGAEINREIKEKTRNKYIIMETNVLADGEKREKTNYGEKVKYYRDGRLVKIVGISGVSGDVISKITYDEYGYKDGKVLEEGELKRYRHGFLDGKSEDIEKGLVKEYNMGVYDGKVDESVDYKGNIYSNGVLLVRGIKKIESNDRKRYLKNIIVREGNDTVLPSKFTGAYYIPETNYYSYSKKGGAEVTFYNKGIIKSKVFFDENGLLGSEEVYNDDNKKIVENFYEGGKLISSMEYDSEGLLLKSIINYFNGKDYTITTRFQGGIPVGYRSIIEKEKVDGGKTKVNILKGYYRAGIYTGAMPHNNENDIENGLKVAKGKSVAVPAGIDNPIVIKKREEVEDIFTYTGYIETEDKPSDYYYGSSKTLTRYEDGVKKEVIKYVSSIGQYTAISRKVYLPSGEVIKYILGTDSGMYIKKSADGRLVEFSTADDCNCGRWVGKMKDGNLIGRLEYYAHSTDKLQEAYEFGVDGSSYKGVFYFGDGSIKSTFEAKRNKEGLLIDVIYRKYKDGKVVETKTEKAVYRVKGAAFNNKNEAEVVMRNMIGDL